eukprot:6780905-Pyramimonas_sp.AAC.1
MPPTSAHLKHFFHAIGGWFAGQGNTFPNKRSFNSGPSSTLGWDSWDLVASISPPASVAAVAAAAAAPGRSPPAPPPSAISAVSGQSLFGL